MPAAKLRCRAWFSDPRYYGFARRARRSELNTCNLRLRTVAEAVKRGV
jgi:hypothetical protein